MLGALGASEPRARKALCSLDRTRNAVVPANQLVSVLVEDLLCRPLRPRLERQDPPAIVARRHEEPEASLASRHVGHEESLARPDELGGLCHGYACATAGCGADCAASCCQSCSTQRRPSRRRIGDCALSGIAATTKAPKLVW